ncbi:MAG: helix-hairpin-helix domain-containing protein [Candidatus Neomarinimicrobiota bacterium]
MPGVGPQRLKAIWQVFGSLEEIANAEAEEIAQQAKVPLAMAEEVRERAREVGGKGDGEKGCGGSSCDRLSHWYCFI